MASVHVIVQSGKHGLGIAVDYYKTIPWEPSPAGDLDLKGATFKKIEKITFDDLLAEMGKGAVGGTTLIVCHAHDEFGSISQSSGLLMPLAAGSGMSAQDDAFQRLLESADAVRRAKTIAAMPARSESEKKAKSEQWIALATDFSLGFPPDDASLPQLEKFFEKGLDTTARNELKLAGGAASLRRMISNLEKVRALKLERVEFRACKIGKDEETLKHLKGLFGCRKLLAPAARTFYIKNMPVENLTRFDKLYIADHRSRQFRRPGPTRGPGESTQDYFTNVIRKNPSTRLFWDVEYGYIPPANPHPSPNRYDSGTSTIKLKGRVLAMLVEEIRRSWYRASAATWNETPVGKPQWDDARKFVEQYVWKKSTYKSGDIMISGFWTPGEELPWLLPSEPEYVDHVAQV